MNLESFWSFSATSFTLVEYCVSSAETTKCWLSRVNVTKSCNEWKNMIWRNESYNVISKHTIQCVSQFYRPPSHPQDFAGNHGNHRNWVPLICWKKSKMADSKKEFFKSPNSQYFFAKISGIGYNKLMRRTLMWLNLVIRLSDVYC